MTNLLDEALGLAGERPLMAGRVVLVEDCVETSGAFVLHHLVKRALSPESRAAVLFVALVHPFSHYDRILRKMGCNLSGQKNNKKLHFFDMLGLEFSGQGSGEAIEFELSRLFQKIQKTVEAISAQGFSDGGTIIMIDDLSILEIVAHGCADHVFDLIHYCITLTSEHGCSLVLLNHEDIYSSMEAPKFLSQLEYFADIVVKTEPLTTGLATDVHGQMTVINRGASTAQGNSQGKVHNFHFKVKESGAEFFYPGSRS